MWSMLPKLGWLSWAWMSLSDLLSDVLRWLCELLKGHSQLTVFIICLLFMVSCLHHLSRTALFHISASPPYNPVTFLLLLLFLLLLSLFVLGQSFQGCCEQLTTLYDMRDTERFLLPQVITPLVMSQCLQFLTFLLWTKAPHLNSNIFCTQYKWNCEVTESSWMKSSVIISKINACPKINPVEFVNECSVSFKKNPQNLKLK